MADFKKLSIGFYCIEPAETRDEADRNYQILAITDFFKGLGANQQTHPIYYPDHIVEQAQHIEQKEGLIIGALIRSQNTDIPPKYNSETKQTSPLSISANEGLGHATCFIYDCECSVLMIQSNRPGVSVGSFCEFYGRSLPEYKIIASLLIDPIQMENLYRMSTITRLKVRVARIQNGTIFESREHTVKRLIDAADNTNTDSLYYEISATKKRGGLNKDKIGSIIRSLMGYKETEEVVNLEVFGYEEDEKHLLPIDFIKNSFKTSIFVSRPRIHNDFNLPEHYDRMFEEYGRFREKILRSYKLNRQ